MKGLKKSIIKSILLAIPLVITLAGCSGTYPQPVNRENTSAVNAAALKEYDLSALHMDLPAKWQLDTSEKRLYILKDAQGEERGSLTAQEYAEDFSFNQVKPNHSSVVSEENIDIPLGECRVITLDADNGPAASGRTGTHDTYYAVITLKDKVIYIVDFSNNDKAPQTKLQFIELLQTLKFKG